MSFNKSFSWNLFGSLLPILVGLLTIPFLIENLGMQLFGVLTLIWALIGYFSLFDFGLGRALTQVVSKYRLDRAKVEVFTSIGLFLILVLGLVGALILIIPVLFMSLDWLGVDAIYEDDTKVALIIASIGIPITTLTTGFRGVLEGYLKFKESNILRMYLGIGNFLLPAITVAFLKPSLTNVAVSLIFVRLAVLFISYNELIKLVRFDFNLLKGNMFAYQELKKFGSWMTVSNIVSPLMVTSDRFFIAAIAGASVVAYYTVPFEIVIRALIIPSALTSAYFAYASNIMTQDLAESRALYQTKLKQTFYLMFVISLSIALFSKTFLTLWVGAEFAEQAWKIMALMGLGIMFNGLAQMPLAAIHARGETKIVALVHLSELIIYIPLLFFFISIFGITGAAMAWVLRAVVDFILMFYFAKH